MVEPARSRAYSGDGVGEVAREHPRHARVAELRYFAGFTLEETAEVLGVARATVSRDWGVAKALLLERLDDFGDPGQPGDSAR